MTMLIRLTNPLARTYCASLMTREWQVMCCDYGFRSGNMRLYQESYGSVPRGVFFLVSAQHAAIKQARSHAHRQAARLTAVTRIQGAENFKKELEQLRRAFRYDEFETVTAAAPPKNMVSKVQCHRSCSLHLAGACPCNNNTRWPSLLPHTDFAPCFAQAVASAGAKVVAGFASLDRQLQKVGILPDLKPAKIPAEVRDESGQLASDCAEVR